MSMDSILRSFSISFLLRNLFAGVFFVVGYRCAARGLAPPFGTDAEIVFSVVAPVALVAGVTIYGLHRSLVYPLLEYWMSSAAGQCLRHRMPLISTSTVRHLRQQWLKDPEKGNADATLLSRKLASWGDYTHLEYTSALCILAGTAVRVLTVNGQYVVSWPLLLLAGMLAFGGLVADWRLRTVQESIEAMRPDPSVKRARLCVSHRLLRGSWVPIVTAKPTSTVFLRMKLSRFGRR